MLAQHEESASRLFLIDAGLDAAALRAKYPIRAQYAIVRGHVQPLVTDVRGRPAVSGVVSEVYCSTINVPVEFRGAIGSGAGRYANANRAPPLESEVKFGRRFEPWIAAVTVARPAAPARAADAKLPG